MADDATTPGLDVQELVPDEHQVSETELHASETEETENLPAGWPCQRRRKGSASELPSARYLDLPTWMTVPAKRQLEEEETV
jgi:hypothetical protein